MTIRRRRLGRDDWIRAALAALSEGGLVALAIPPLSRRLGVTKGSFYWHFDSLDGLVAAALERWTVTDARARIAELEAITDPRQRLRTLMTPQRDDGIARVDLALAASAADPRVAPWLAEHNRLWLEFARRAFREMGLADAEIEHRAILAYTSYLGLLSLRVSIPESLATPDQLARYLAFLRDLVIPP